MKLANQIPSTDSTVKTYLALRESWNFTCHGWMQGLFEVKSYPC